VLHEAHNKLHFQPLKKMKEYGRIINAISKNLIRTTEQNEQNRVKRALIQYFRKVQEFEVEETDP